MKQVTMVRIYLTEGENQLKPLLSFLHDEEEVCGVTAFRGIAGFGKSGKMHASGLLDLSLDLPLAIEFFDEPEKVARIVRDLKERVAPGHLVCWEAQVQ
ncbi:MAG: DUF190 domain-containing protein [Pseudomonadota bacterium]